jgi:hypothetical protein
MSVDPVASRLAGTGVAFAPQIASAARRNGLDPDLLAAIAAQETGGPDTNTGHNIVGDGGHGHGLFQIDDRWHAFASTPAAMDPEQNAAYAAGMLSDLLKRYGGNVHQALSAYNAGSPTAVGTRTRWSDGSDLPYADSVLRHYERITNCDSIAKENTMSSVPAIIEGSLLSKPLDAKLSGSVSAALEGSKCGAVTGESPQDSAIAEIGTLISSLGALSAQAQSLPLSPPTLPGAPQKQTYRPQVTDYMQFAENPN